MKACHRCEVQRANREAILGMALSRYQFATPEIRTLMRIVLGHAISGRTLKASRAGEWAPYETRPPAEHAACS